MPSCLIALENISSGFLKFILRQGLKIAQPGLKLAILLRADITGMHHHTWLQFIFLFFFFWQSWGLNSWPFSF
jgi:hypothetical protein